MKKALLASLCGVVSLALSGEASAQTLGKHLDVVFSADRMFGLTFSKVTTENPGRRDDELDASRISFGWGGRGVISPYEIPRAAIDVFVTEQLSIGGSIGFSSVSLEWNDDRGSPDYDTFLFAPRVGYIWPLSDAFSFWLRGGFSYHSADDNENGLGLSVEPTFVLTPAEHFGIVFGPTVDMDITGGVNSGPNRLDRRHRTFGLLQVGILGWI